MSKPSNVSASIVLQSARKHGGRIFSFGSPVKFRSNVKPGGAAGKPATYWVEMKFIMPDGSLVVPDFKFDGVFACSSAKKMKFPGADTAKVQIMFTTLEEKDLDIKEYQPTVAEYSIADIARIREFYAESKFDEINTIVDKIERRSTRESMQSALTKHMSTDEFNGWFDGEIKRANAKVEDRNRAIAQAKIDDLKSHNLWVQALDAIDNGYKIAIDEFERVVADYKLAIPYAVKDIYSIKQTKFEDKDTKMKKDLAHPLYRIRLPLAADGEIGKTYGAGSPIHRVVFQYTREAPEAKLAVRGIDGILRMVSLNADNINKMITRMSLLAGVLTVRGITIIKNGKEVSLQQEVAEVYVRHHKPEDRARDIPLIDPDYESQEMPEISESALQVVHKSRDPLAQRGSDRGSERDARPRAPRSRDADSHREYSDERSDRGYDSRRPRDGDSSRRDDDRYGRRDDDRDSRSSSRAESDRPRVDSRRTPAAYDEGFPPRERDDRPHQSYRAPVDRDRPRPPVSEPQGRDVDRSRPPVSEPQSRDIDRPRPPVSESDEYYES